jgi:hypothetical protein
MGGRRGRSWGGFLRRFAAPRREHRALRPAVGTLEGRCMPVVAGNLSVVNVSPPFLTPTSSPNYEQVTISGALAVNHDVAPVGKFFVTDEYRADEPRGNLTIFPNSILTRQVGTFTFDYFPFTFTLNLSTQRSTKTPDGRHYYLFVGGTDADGTGGRIVDILSPKVVPHPRAAAHRHTGA